ncbi:HME family heavy-metal exporter [Azospirillum lipoferum]|uniref:Efflux RND transporter permease subunit n=1 Tax=Azospirillum lipoferum TaxID=193 RepID=A0A5A9GL28_AZOLI|nr:MULTISPECIES: efflux RND transporter permease subunit [Azospirillum]KAA0595170.1 efflux RND transporter permease subunit [Azospirillum lipoferum]MCP1611960.1 HME family heavy-metal exporter [Azospirillum lipoferum]MDW5533281.1 efflux RND transporter permease subunit [Azospirillum sp. NL1]
MFQAIVAFSLRQRVFVLVASAILVAWGLFVARDVPIDLLPELRQPTVNVVTESGSLAAEEVEQLVTVPIESALSGIAGVTRVRSTSSASFSRVMAVFAWGTNPQLNRQLVMERLAQVRDRLPAGLQPQMAPMSAATGLIMHMGVTGGADPMALRDYVELVLRPRILAQEGVAQAFLIGGQVKTFRFTPDPVAMNDLGITLQQVEQALTAFGTNSSGGFAETRGQEFPIRNIGKSSRLEDMRKLVVAYRDGTPVLLSQIGSVEFSARLKRGDGAFNGIPSVNVAIVKHPSANTVQVDAAIRQLLADMQATAPSGIKLGQISYSQADMINEAIANVGDILRDGVIIVAVVLMLFLANVRSTAISLLAIPISLVVSVLVFHMIGATLNTMTLGGIAIALGELVDDSVVDVENILRRLGENRKQEKPEPVMTVIARASQEVRSGIVYATAIILLVFIPLFAMPGQPGRMFGPLAMAYIVSIFASLVVSVTITPVLASYLFPRMRGLENSHEGRFLCWLKQLNRRGLMWVFDRSRQVLIGVGIAVVLAAASVPLLPRSFLPEFNEGNIYVTLLLNPGTSLEESYRIGHMAEQIIMQVPEVKAISRRAGRYEQDADGDPVNDNEMPIKIVLDQGRSRHEVMADIRRRLSIFSADLSVTQFLTERMQSEDSGVRGAIILKIYGQNLATLRTLAERFREKFSNIPGLVDLLVEQQQFTPQLRVTVDYERAEMFGITPAAVTQALESFTGGRTVSQIIDGLRRYDVVMRLNDGDRAPEKLGLLRIDTPSGSVALSSFATISVTPGPSLILREDAVRRIAVMANTDGSDTAKIVAEMRELIASTPLPVGYRTSLEGSFREGESGRMMMAILTPISIALIFLVLHQRFRSWRLCLIVMGNIPLAVAGSVAALWISGQDLSLAALIGFIAVTGVAVRNSLLKVSHFINLNLHEGMPIGRELILRGCAERLTPVLMTAMAAGLALIPLLFVNDRAGTEILQPVAVAIFGGLISSTLLDTFTTPLLFELFGQREICRVIATDSALAYETF